MSQLWLSRREYAKRASISRKTLDRYASEGKVECRLSEKRSRNGKPEREFLWTGGALALRASEAPPVNLSEKQQAEHDQWMAWLAPMRQAEEDGRGLSSALADVTRASGMAKPTIWKKWTLYKRGKPLARKSRRDRDQRRIYSSEKYPKLAPFLIAKFIETNRNLAAACDAKDREWGGPLLPYAPPAPGRETCRDIIAKDISRAALDAATLPKQKWAAKNAPFMVTGRGDYTHPLECGVVDNAIDDYLCQDDCFNNDLAARRLSFTALQDMRTRVITGWAVSLNPSSDTFITVIRRSAALFGVFELVYMDNGKDFRAKILSAGAQRGSLLAGSQAVRFMPGSDGILTALGTKVCYCTPRHPQAKQIESFFNYRRRRFDMLFLGCGYTGATPAQRPDYCREHEKQHKDFLEGKRAKSPLLRASECIRLVGQFIDEYNFLHPHNGRGMNGRTPMQVMDELLPVEQRNLPDMAALAPLFWQRATLTVTNGKVKIKGATYSAAFDHPEGQMEMHQANGGSVSVRFDPNDPTHALAYENRADGRLLSPLVSDEIGAQSRPTAETVKAMFVERARLYRADKEARKALTAGVPSELELLARRGGIQHKATGTDGPLPRHALGRGQPASAPQSPEDFAESFFAESDSATEGGSD